MVVISAGAAVAWAIGRWDMAILRARDENMLGEFMLTFCFLFSAVYVK